MVLFLQMALGNTAASSAAVLGDLRAGDRAPVPAKLLAPWTKHLHVFNWKNIDGKTKKYALAQAVDTWKAYLAQMPGQRALLLEFMPDNCLETLAAEAAALKVIAE